MATPASSTLPAVALGYRRYAWVVVALMLASGALALIGWLFDSPMLTRLLPTSPAMKANTAIGFVLSGLALAQFLRRSAGCGVLSLLVALLGALTLVEYLGDIALGIDGLFPDPEAQAAGRIPGRMSQLTAIGFLLLGLRGSLACLDRIAWLRDPLSVLLLGIAMIGLASLGFLLAGVATDDLPFNPVPVHVALLFLLAGLAWMAAEPERGMTRISAADSFGGALARRLLLPSLLLPLLIIYAGQLLQSQLGYSETMMRTLSAVLTGGAVASLIWWVSNLLDRVEREREETQRMRDSAATDGLTGLPNRRAFDEALAGLLKGRRERDVHFSLLMIDLDHFKSFNDNFGHLAGDDALRITARLLRDAVRPGDLPARYGGEEFVVLLPGSRGAQGQQIGERINELFRREVWPNRPVTVSVGIAEAHHGDDSASLIARADAALYAAKHGGRDRTVLAELPISAAG